MTQNEKLILEACARLGYSEINLRGHFDSRGVYCGDPDCCVYTWREKSDWRWHTEDGATAAIYMPGIFGIININDGELETITGAETREEFKTRIMSIITIKKALKAAQ